MVGGMNGVHITYNSDGRVSGDAFVELDTAEDLSIALDKDKEHMGKRYIDGIIVYYLTILLFMSA